MSEQLTLVAPVIVGVDSQDFLTAVEYMVEQAERMASDVDWDTVAITVVKPGELDGVTPDLSDWTGNVLCMTVQANR